MRAWNRAVGLLLGLSSVVWSTAALAQETTVVRQETVPPQSERETVSEKGGPSTGMLTSGIVTFGVSYGIAATVALSSDRDSDQRMIVPFAGPWIALAEREGCGEDTSRSCDGETMNKVLIATDGVFQALGGVLVIGAFLNPQERTVTRTRAAEPRITIAPKIASGSYGLTAVGRF